MDLNLTPTEKKLLVQVLERTLGDLRTESRRLDAPACREMLRDEESVVIGLLDRLRTPRFVD